LKEGIERYEQQQEEKATEAYNALFAQLDSKLE
jgi:hypothetical protein